MSCDDSQNRSDKLTPRQMRYRREKEAKRDAEAKRLAWELMSRLPLKDFRALQEFVDAILGDAMDEVMP